MWKCTNSFKDVFVLHFISSRDVRGWLGAVFHLIVWVLFHCRKLTYLTSTLLPFTWHSLEFVFALDHDQSMFCDLFTKEKCACFIWYYLEGYPMFFVFFEDGNSHTSKNFSFAVSCITVFVVTGWSFWHCGSLKSCWYTDLLIIDTSAVVSNLTLRYFGFDDCEANCKLANTHLLGLDAFTVHKYITSKLSLSESSACRQCGDSLNASIAFTSSTVFTCVLCFWWALAGEVTIVLALLALVLSCRTVKSWSVPCVSTMFTYVWANWWLRFWFLWLLSLSVQLPLLRVWLEWLLCQMALWILVPAFPVVHFGSGLPCFQTWLTPSALGSLPVALVPLMCFAVARPASSFSSFCQIVAAVTSGDSSLMIFEMKAWSFRPNRKMSHCRTDSMSGL